jgi:hypothetical protein
MKYGHATVAHQLFRLLVRVTKADSAFLYFQLESNEGLCFYSTLDSSLGTTYRDLELIGSLEFEGEILRLLEHLRTAFPVEILLHDHPQDAHGLSNPQK